MTESAGAGSVLCPVVGSWSFNEPVPFSSSSQLNMAGLGHFSSPGLVKLW